jgi:hypothetical protein
LQRALICDRPRRLNRHNIPACYATVRPGRRSNSSLSAKVAACSARLRTASRAAPGGSLLAS